MVIGLVVLEAEELCSIGGTLMLIDVGKLLSSLQVAEEDTATGIVLCGWLAPSAPGQLRILVDDLCLCFDQADLLEIEPNPMAESAKRPSSAVGIQVVIRRGARLLDICLSKVYEGLFAGRKPFALAVRPLTIRTNANTTLDES
jgi:hypothetical protein